MKNLFGYTRVLAIGDIHGVYDKLIKLMDKIRFSPEDDLLVFLGDYIDRGPDSVKCLQYVFDLQHSQTESVVCLLGNHEVMMSSYFMQKHGSYNNLIEDYADAWLDNGGFETLRQLNMLDREKREELVNWAANLPVQFRYQEFFFCHAGIDAGLPMEVQSEFDMLWKREGWIDKYNGEETIVVGHTPVQKVQKQVDYTRRVPKPLFLPNNIIMCDTGVYMTGGKLSCVDVLSRKVWQQ